LNTGRLAEPVTMFCETLVGIYRCGITVLLRRFGGKYPLFNNPKDHDRNTHRESLKKYIRKLSYMMRITSDRADLTTRLLKVEHP
jgi:hypothetical protein